MLENCTQHFKESRKECKGLLKEKKNLMQELDELRASYESLKVDHKTLQKSHTKLEEAHSSLVEKCKNMPTNVEKGKTCNIGISCDIIDESFHKPLLLLPLTLHVAHLHHPHLVVTVSLMTPH
jgi:predicted nuclease with TOPRIM domain